MCPECGLEILALTPVRMEELPDGRTMVRHAKCGPPEEEEDEAI